MSSTREKISVDEACQFLECAKPKLLELLGDGELPGLKLGKAWVIPRDAFFSAVNEMAHAHADILANEKKQKQAPAPVPIKQLGRPRLPRGCDF